MYDDLNWAGTGARGTSKALVPFVGVRELFKNWLSSIAHTLHLGVIGQVLLVPILTLSYAPGMDETLIRRVS